jgi:hypothetical protein
MIEPGKPHIFLLGTPQREKDHFAKYIDLPEAATEYAAIVDALFVVVETKSLSEENLTIIRNGMNSRFKAVYEQAGRRLVQLSHYFDEAGDALLALSVNQKSSMRLRVVQAIWSDLPPQDIADKIIRAGLHDKNISIRIFAASRIGQLKLKHLLAELQQVKVSETNEKVLTSIDYALDELKH